MGWRDWTGVGEGRWKKAPDEEVRPAKTLWDWLQLLIVPVMLVAISLWWTAQQDRRDEALRNQQIAADRVAAEEVRQDATLNTYFQQMSDLMLNKGLLASKRGDAVRSVARTVTLTTLRRLDAERKGEAVHFLQEAGLIAGSRERPVDFALARVVLEQADLTGADLTEAFLLDTNLAYADLEGARLTHANLADADLRGANLRDADLRFALLSDAAVSSASLSGADLRKADLSDSQFGGSDFTDANLTDASLSLADLAVAKLTRADLTHAYLGGAVLRYADLRGADLRGADLTDADLTRADFRGANLEGADLRRAIIKGAKGLPESSG